jgi:two-component system secretion response regulator SsrB
MRTRVMVMERQQLVREGLAAMLARGPDLELIGLTGDGGEGVRLASRLRPDVVVMDLQIPGLNAPDAIRRIVATSPPTHVLCLAAGSSPQLMKAALDGGARGIIAMDASAEELLRAVLSLTQRQLYLSPSVAEQAMAACSLSPQQNDAFRRLTPKEREVVQLLAEGHSTKQVASRLSVSFKTVATHREHAMSKLGLRGVADLTRYAIREGLTFP